jgi:hypothetical protein
MVIDLSNPIHYNIMAVNVFTNTRRVIPVRGDLPREEVMREVNIMNADKSSAFHYVLTTEGV